MSKEHIKYINKIKKDKHIIFLSQILLFIIIISLWQLITDLKLIDSFIISSPKNIIKTLINLYNSNNLLNHINITLYELFISFLISIMLSIMCASTLWYFPKLAKVLEPYFTLINSLPKVALGPIILIWFGTNIKSIIIMATLISSIIITINIYNGFISVDRNKIKLINSFTNNKYYLFKYLIFPSNIQLILSNLKICISMSLIGIIMGEFLVSKRGIGYLILYGSQVFNLDLVMTGIFLLCLLAILLYLIINTIEKNYTNKFH